MFNNLIILEIVIYKLNIYIFWQFQMISKYYHFNLYNSITANNY